MKVTREIEIELDVTLEDYFADVQDYDEIVKQIVNFDFYDIADWEFTIKLVSALIANLPEIIDDSAKDNDDELSALLNQFYEILKTAGIV